MKLYGIWSKDDLERMKEDYKRYPKQQKCSHCGAPAYLLSSPIHKPNCTNVQRRKKC